MLADQRKRRGAVEARASSHRAGLRRVARPGRSRSRPARPPPPAPAIRPPTPGSSAPPRGCPASSSTIRIRGVTRPAPGTQQPGFRRRINRGLRGHQSHCPASEFIRLDQALGRVQARAELQLLAVGVGQVPDGVDRERYADVQLDLTSHPAHESLPSASGSARSRTIRSGLRMPSSRTASAASGAVQTSISSVQRSASRTSVRSTSSSITRVSRPSGSSSFVDARFEATAGRVNDIRVPSPGALGLILPPC